MTRRRTALVTLLALAALAAAAGTFDAVDGPAVGDGATPTPRSSATPEPSGTDSIGGASDGDTSGAPTRTTPGPAADGGGLSPLVVPGVVGSLFAGALLVVVLTGDDDRVPDGPPTDDERDGPLPGVDPAYESPDDAVARAWRTLRDRVDGDETATPGEVAAAAVERHLPESAVATVTERFRAVRYGDDAPSDDGREVAVDAARRLDDEGRE